LLGNKISGKGAVSLINASYVEFEGKWRRFLIVGNIIGDDGVIIVAQELVKIASLQRINISSKLTFSQSTGQITE